MLVLVSAAQPAQAQDGLASLISSLFGRGGLGGGGGRYVPGDPASQVIPLLQQIYSGVMNSSGVDNKGKDLQTQTARQIADYEQQNEWERERRLRNNDIVRDYPEMSNLSCGIATANQSVPIIETAADNARSKVMDILTNGMYESAIANTAISANKKAEIWCKLGAVANDETCKTQPDPLVVGCDRNRHPCIAKKHSIPCDMQAVEQEFQNMAQDGYTPAAKHKECVAAILAIANEFELAGALPTKSELQTTQGVVLRGEKKNAIARAWATKGAALQEFVDVVSVSKNAAAGCDNGLRGGGEDVYTLLQERYRNTNRSNKVAPFGLPPNDSCLSIYQVRLGKKMLRDRYFERYAGNLSWQESIKVNALINNDMLDPMRDRTYATYPGDNNTGDTDARASRPVASNDAGQEQLLGAIRQLTAQIKQMNDGVYSGKALEVRQKDNPKENMRNYRTRKDDEAIIHDALKEMGLKVSSGAPSKGNGRINPTILHPITPEFPVVR